MKKVIASISLVCYFVVTCGVVFNEHYCMNKLASTQLFGSVNKTCGVCGMDSDEPSGCCHDEVKLAKLVQDQNSTSLQSYDIPSLKIFVTTSCDFIAASYISIDVKKDFYNYSPPLLSEQDTFLQNSVFRI
jgi:hypothetical protein